VGRRTKEEFRNRGNSANPNRRRPSNNHCESRSAVTETRGVPSQKDQGAARDPTLQQRKKKSQVGGPAGRDIQLGPSTSLAKNDGSTHHQRKRQGKTRLRQGCGGFTPRRQKPPAKHAHLEFFVEQTRRTVKAREKKTKPNESKTELREIGKTHSGSSVMLLFYPFTQRPSRQKVAAGIRITDAVQRRTDKET